MITLFSLLDIAEGQITHKITGTVRPGCFLWVDVKSLMKMNDKAAKAQHIKIVTHTLTNLHRQHSRSVTIDLLGRCLIIVSDFLRH